MSKPKTKKGPLKVQPIYYFVHDNGDGSASVVFSTDRKRAKKKSARDQKDDALLSDGDFETLELEVDPVTGKVVSGLPDDDDDDNEEEQDGSDEESDEEDDR